MTTSWWLDGVALDSPHISLDSPLARLGDGVFETIGVDDSVPRWLDLHLARLAASATAHELDLPTMAVIREWVERAVTAAGAGSFAMRLLATSPDDGRRASIYVSTTPYSPPAFGAGLALHPVTVEHPGLTAAGKNTSWLWARAAMRQAKRAGADEALLMRGQYVVETSTAAIVYRRGGSWFACGEGEGALASTTLQVLRTHLVVEARQTTLADLAGADALVLLSSLRLATPVASLCGVHYKESADAARLLRELLLRTR